MEEVRQSTPRHTDALNPAPRTKFPFVLKLIVVMTALVVVPLLVVGTFTSDRTTRELERANRELRISVIREIASALDKDFELTRDVLSRVAAALVDDGVDEKTTIANIKRAVSQSDLIDHVAIYDASGAWIDTVRTSTEDFAPSKQLAPDLMQLASKEGEGAIAGPTGRWTLVLPLTVQGNVTGFVASSISLARIEKSLDVLTHAHFADFADSLFVLDQNFDVVVQVESGNSQARSMKDEPIVDGVDPRAFRNDTALTREYLRDGRAYVGTLSSWKGWVIGAQVPEDFAYATAIEVRRVLLFTLCIALLLSVGLAILIARQLTKPIDQLSSFARQLAQRKFTARVTVTSNDELAFLGSAMSAAAADLEESEKLLQHELEIRSDLGRYVPQQVVDRVVRREQDMHLGGRRSDITVLFADIVAFTPLTEKIAAEQTVSILNELFTILTEIVFKHGGTLDKFIGDCVMAVWGAPDAHPDHADRALDAAQDMLRWLEAGNEAWYAKYGIRLQLAIGVNSGPAVVGNIGSKSRMQYTAIGDVVNVAARLEAIARPGQVLVTDATKQLATEHTFQALGAKQLLGRSESIELYELQ